MTFEVKDASGRTLYEGDDWVIAQSALNFAVMKGDGWPTLSIRS